MVMFADPKEWWLELSPTMQAEAVRQSQQCSTVQSRQQAYLNALCLNGVLGWLRADVPDVRPWVAPALLPTVWEVVNGSVVNLGAIRLVLVPTEAIDGGALEVPQEWVDSPSWAGNYYLAVQVKPERGWVRVWGYATHQDLKSLGRYDSMDRTYSLDAEQLTPDLNALWATYQHCGAEQTQTTIAAIPDLAPNQADALIQRLGDRAVFFPRLAVPFSLWAALLERDEWRQALYERRCGLEQAQPAVMRLSEWLQGQFAEAWQAVDQALSPAQAATAWRSGEAVGEASLAEALPEYTISRVKTLQLGADAMSGLNSGAISLLLGITPISATQVDIGLHVCPVAANATFLQEIQVRLLDGTGAEIGQAGAAVTETIQFQFRGQVGEQFSVEVTMGDRTLTEVFEI
jgi:Protein of unknown function (DUF1822)